ncbi:dihydrodipicolinate synthase family protein [Herbaspirillum autotrophicum]|uniref:dihydrodipicolinate synthase family protein n=1 Tax=Herbaspirillum autotrophicum TaxID=180195 RepID=UPI0022B6649A|nr:dihydrodipicolinate synthase family protein [Herbaspirillum autotrophicum]
MDTTLHGLWPALMTPLDAQSGLDTAKGVAHAKSLLAAGCDGVTLFGTTGEGPAFSVAERLAFVDALIAAGIPAARLIICSAAASNIDQIAIGRHASEHGCAAFLLLPPFFFRNPGEQGVIDSVAEVIDGIGDPKLAVILYHIPQLSSVHFTSAVITTLVQRFPQQIFAVKDSAGNLQHSLALIKAFPQLKVFVGAEEHIAPAMQIGGAGSVCGLANLAPRLMKRVIAKPAELSTQDAALMGKLLGLIGQHSFVNVFKTVLAEQKNDAAWLRVRAPLSPLDDTARETILAAYRELKLDAATL